MRQVWMCNRTMCKRRSFKVGEIFHYDGHGVVCSDCWAKDGHEIMEGEA